MAINDRQTGASDLLADVRLYAAHDGGKSCAALRGYRCPCFVSKDTQRAGWDAELQLEDEPFEPGTERRVSFVFLSPEGAETMRRAGRFYLWEGGFIGEANVVRG